MTVTFGAWLPLSALEDSRIADVIGAVVDRWSARWFAHDGYRVVKQTVRPRGYRSSRSDASRKFFGAGAVFGWPDDDGIAMAKHALDAPHGRVDLQRADAGLLRAYAETIARDLALSISAALLQNSTAADVPLGDAADPFRDGGGLDVDLGASSALPSLHIAIAAADLVALRKSYVRSTAPAPLQPVALGSAFDTEALDYTATLGTARMSLAAAQTLTIGDVVVLDTKLDDSVRIATRRSDHSVAVAKVSQQDGRIQLVARAA